VKGSRRPDARGPLIVYVLFVAFVACVWLNQSVGGKDWEALRDRTFAAPREHPLLAARYPFVFLYRRSLDERYYYETSGAILGLPADEAVLAQMHGKMPAQFRAALPPPDGHLHAPYIEVPLEYPPLNIPWFVLPHLFVSTFEAYGYAFGALMGLCLLGAIAVAIAVARRGGVTEADSRRRWLLAAGLLLAQGALAIQRLDPIATLFLALALWSAVRRRPFGLGLWAGLAAAAKILPLLVLPAIVAADLGSFRSRKARLELGAGVAVALAVGLGPVLVSPRALASMLDYHLQRGLNVEATLGALLGMGRMLVGHARPASVSFGSANLDGPAADLLAKLCAPLMLVALVALVWRILRSKETDTEAARVDRIASSALAATVVLWLTSKVLSPQYLTWSIPLVLALPGKTAERATWTAIVAMALTQLYFRGFYNLLVAQRPVALAVLGLRQGLLFLLLAFALRGLRRPSEQALPVVECGSRTA
jgi:hypothetical protein